MKKKLPSREFAQEVKKELSVQATHPGRKPLPAFVKGMRRILKEVDNATSEPIGDKTFEAIKPEDVEDLLQDLDKHLAKLSELRDQVAGAAASAKEKALREGAAKAAAKAEKKAAKEEAKAKKDAKKPPAAK